jgi:hypothetical protein
VVDFVKEINMNFIRKNKYLLICILLFIVTNIFFQSSFLFNWDAGQLALGTQNYSLSIHQPQPPGYFSYIYLAKFINILINDINLSFILINFLAGLLTIIFLFKSLFLLSNKIRIAFWITVIFIFNPLFWFHHLVALTYIFEALLASILFYLTTKQLKNNKTNLVLSSFLTGVIAGFRPSVVIIALPFLIVQLIHSQKKLKTLFLSFGFFILALSMWFPFLVLKTGGIENFFSILIAQALVAKNTNVYNINHHIFLLKTIVYSLNVLLIIVLFKLKKIFWFLKNNKLYFLPVIIIYQLLIYTFFHFGEAGYLLSIIPLYFILLLPVIEKIYSKSKIIRYSILFLIIISQLLIFNFNSKITTDHKLNQLNYKNIVKHDKRIETWLSYVKKYKSDETLIIILRGQFLDENSQVSSYDYDDIRILSYYLPDYKLYDLLGVNNLYFISFNHDYSQVNDNTVIVPNGYKKIIFLADYIYPDMRPKNLNLKPLKKGQHYSNIYTAEFLVDSFEYNGITFQKRIN